ncbi:hypothetical protein [Pseudarthrobacter sp. H2]|uniref:hypothetical protein n=1 Tax=Pseudarthrobacter sp. H2 TaxID=3418415 RepID=UPI003CED1E2D
MITAVLGAAILLGGCTAPSGLKALDRQATAEDKMPEGITFQGTDVNTENARLLASKDGVKYFAAKNENIHEACVVIAPEANPSLWVAGFSSYARGGEIVKVTGSTGQSAVHVTDGADTGQLQSESWTKVHDNVLTSGR